MLVTRFQVNQQYFYIIYQYFVNTIVVLLISQLIKHSINELATTELYLYQC